MACKCSFTTTPCYIEQWTQQPFDKPLSIDTHIEYDLDYSLFPGLEQKGAQPSGPRQPALLIAPWWDPDTPATAEAASSSPSLPEGCRVPSEDEDCYITDCTCPALGAGGASAAPGVHQQPPPALALGVPALPRGAAAATPSTHRHPSTVYHRQQPHPQPQTTLQHIPRINTRQQQQQQHILQQASTQHQPQPQQRVQSAAAIADLYCLIDSLFDADPTHAAQQQQQQQQQQQHQQQQQQQQQPQPPPPAAVDVDWLVGNPNTTSAISTTTTGPSILLQHHHPHQYPHLQYQAQQQRKRKLVEVDNTFPSSVTSSPTTDFYNSCISKRQRTTLMPPGPLDYPSLCEKRSCNDVITDYVTYMDSRFRGGLVTGALGQHTAAAPAPGKRATIDYRPTNQQCVLPQCVPQVLSYQQYPYQFGARPMSGEVNRGY